MLSREDVTPKTHATPAHKVIFAVLLTVYSYVNLNNAEALLRVLYRNVLSNSKSQTKSKSR